MLLKITFACLCANPELAHYTATEQLHHLKQHEIRRTNISYDCPGIRDFSNMLESVHYWLELNERFVKKNRTAEQNVRWATLQSWNDSFKKQLAELLCGCETPNQPMLRYQTTGDPISELPLHVAVDSQNYDQAKLLLLLGANPNLQCKYHYDEPAIFSARNLKVAKLLIKFRANLNYYDPVHPCNFPLLYRCIGDPEKPAELLDLYLEKGAMWNIKIANNTLLHFSALFAPIASKANKLDELIKKIKILLAKTKINLNEVHYDDVEDSALNKSTALDITISLHEKKPKLRPFIEFLRDAGAKKYEELKNESSLKDK